MASFNPETYVYLDWAATAPLCEEAARAMEPFLVPDCANVALGANANSLHSPGRSAFAALEEARRALSRCLGARRASEVLFTSGATESDNAAILGMAHAAVAARKQAGKSCGKPHVVTSAMEHEAVLEPVARLEREGFRVTRLTPDAQGFLLAEALEEALCDDTVLVSMQAANSEVGSVQPVAELAHVAHARGALFHTDATQALGKIFVDVGAWDVDAASFSAHKIGGPKGVGALYLRARTPFEAFLLGGGQEEGRRSGTQNVCGAAGFAAACRAATAAIDEEAARQRALRDFLYEGLSRYPCVSRTIDVQPGSACFLPSIVHVLVEGFESQTLIIRLDALGFGVSGGSACSSHDLEPSRVLRALGVSRDKAQGALRVSFGRLTTEDDVRAFVEAFGKAVAWDGPRCG